MTCTSALVSAGFSVVAMLAPAAPVTAFYAGARSLPMAVVVLWLAWRRSRAGMVTMGALLALVQASDAVVGVAQKDAGKTIGPAVLALATALSAGVLARHSRAAVNVRS